MTAPASHERVYRALLRLYPAAFRARFGDELVQLAGDVLRDAGAGRAGRGLVRTWLGLVVDVALTAPAEQFEQRRVARSLSRPASALTKALGLLGVAGGLILVSAFLFFIPGTFNLGRLVLFNVGAAAIAVAMARPLRDRFGRRADVVVALVICANIVYAGMTLYTAGFEHAFAGLRGVIFGWVTISMWLGDAIFGLVAIRLGGRARLGGIALALGGLGILGMDQFWSPSDLASAVALAGVGLNGIGWIVLGLAVAMSRRSADAPASVP